jgi:hypothetical protein
MNAREYKKLENVTSSTTSKWIFRIFCTHEYVAYILDKNCFEKEHKHLYITCSKCGKQYICKNLFE